MLNTLRNRLLSIREKNENGSALVTVVLVTLLLLMATTAVTYTVMTSQNQTKVFNINQQARSTADTGLSSFLASVNTSTGYRMLETYKAPSAVGAAQRTTPGNALCKSVDATIGTQVGYQPRWCVWTVKVASSTGTVGYYVYSKGFTVPTASSTARSNANDEVVVRVLVEPLSVARETQLVDGRVTYSLPEDSPFQLGLTGSTSFRANAGAKIYSNDFAMNTAPTGTEKGISALASNDLLALYPDLSVSTLTAPATKTVAQICTPVGSAACTEPVQRLSPVSTSVAFVEDQINTRCPLPIDDYPIWKASEHGNSTIPPGCYASVDIDRSMAVGAGYTSTNPLEIFVKGQVIIRSHSTVADNRDPAAFQIRAIGSVRWEDHNASPSNPTSRINTNAYIVSGSSCTSAANTKTSTVINGALTCNIVILGARTTVYMDTKSQQYGIDMVDGAPAGSVWFATGIQQV